MTHDVEKFQPLEVILGQEVINIATIFQIVKAAGHDAVRTALGGQRTKTVKVYVPGGCLLVK
jgi:hypothetical protein